MRRKLMRMGQNTLVVTLPHQWVKQCKLQKGDCVNFQPMSRRLQLSPDPQKPFGKITYDLRGLNDDTTKWAICALHKSGYDAITVTYDSPHQLDLIKAEFHEVYLGFVLDEHGTHSCTFRNVARDLQTEFDTNLLRAFQTTHTMGRETLNTLKTGRSEALRPLLTYDGTTNLMANFCERILNRYGAPDSTKTCFYYVLAWNIEKLCDRHKYLIQYLLDHPTVTLSKDTLAFYEEVNAQVQACLTLLTTFHMEALEALNEACERLTQDGHTLTQRLPKKDLPALLYLLEMVAKVKEFSVSLIGIHLPEAS